jgi:hypothetical protein
LAGETFVFLYLLISVTLYGPVGEPLRGFGRAGRRVRIMRAAAQYLVLPVSLLLPVPFTVGLELSVQYGRCRTAGQRLATLSLKEVDAAIRFDVGRSRARRKRMC